MEIRQPNSTWRLHEGVKGSDIIAMTLDQKGNLYVVDWMNSLVKKISPDGRFAIHGILPDQTYHKIWSIAIDSHNHLYMCDSDRSVIYRMAPDGSVYDFLHLPHPGSIIIDSSSNIIYVTCDGCVLWIETKEYDGSLEDRPTGKFYAPHDKHDSHLSNRVSPNIFESVTDPQHPIIVPKTIVRYAGPFSRAIKRPQVNIIPITQGELGDDFSAWWNFNCSALIDLIVDNKGNIYIIAQPSPEFEKQVLYIIPPQGQGSTLTVKCPTDGYDKALTVGLRGEIYHNIVSSETSYLDTIEVLEPTPNGKYKRKRLPIEKREIRALGFDPERERLYIVHDKELSVYQFKAEIPSLEMLCLGILVKHPLLYSKYHNRLPEKLREYLPIEHQHKRRKTKL